MDAGNHTLLVIFVAMTGVSVFLQLCVFIIFIVALKKTATAITSAKAATDDFKDSVIPVLHSTRELLERVSPQIATISEGLAEIIQLLHRESKGVSVSVSDIMARVNRQSEHLDELLTKGLNSVERAGTALESAVTVPIRQANGVVAALKAMLETYRSGNPKRKAPPTVTYQVASPQPYIPPVQATYSDVPATYADVPVTSATTADPKI
jgi:uncharacterized protein YoxC